MRPPTARDARASRAALAGALVLVCLATIDASGQAPQSTPTPASSRYPMAERITGLRGLQNLGRVAPGLYRGNAPSAAGLDSLKALGIKTVVNLRHYHGSREEKACRARGLGYVGLRLASSDTPSDASVRRFLEVVTDPARRPVYFNCWRGKDRTGAMCAVYRMAVDDWPLEAALAEMDAFGFYRGWKDLRRFVESFPRKKATLWPEKR